MLTRVHTKMPMGRKRPRQQHISLSNCLQTPHQDSHGSAHGSFYSAHGSFDRAQEDGSQHSPSPVQGGEGIVVQSGSLRRTLQELRAPPDVLTEADMHCESCQQCFQKWFKVAGPSGLHE